MRHIAIGAFTMLCIASSLTAAQRPSDSPAFDVVSVKPVQSGEGRPQGALLMANGQFIAPFATLQELTAYAHGVEPVQVTGGPRWATRDHFAIEARTRPGTGADDL